MASIVRADPASGSAHAASDGATVSTAPVSAESLAAGDDAASTDTEVTVSFPGDFLFVGDAAAGAGIGGGEAVAVGGAASVTAGEGDAAAVALNGLAALRGRLR